MYRSNSFGRIFWVDDNLEFRSCPLKLDNTGDYKYADYVSEWQDLEGLKLDKLLNIHRIELFNKVNHGGSLLNNDFELTEDVYNEVKKCYTNDNLEDNISYLDSLLTAGT